MLDIRIPIGLMFTILGIILLAFGIVSHFGLLSTNPEIYKQHSLGINVNCYWGILMLVFGVLMLLFARFRRQN
jgi:hypothetical protein